MDETTIARAATTIQAPAGDVWQALVTPETIAKYMFGAQVDSDWREGSPIVWKGEWQGKPFEDKGKILRVEAPRVLQYSHYSPLSGQPDAPESYHTVTIELAEQGPGRTRVTLTQDGNRDAEAREHSEKNWGAMLDGMRKVLEA
jgi:uncharacterized protein YndB with AHSA1/START domain